MNRSTFYYVPKGESKENLEIMEKMDKQYTNHPTSGVKTMRSILKQDNLTVNPKRIRRLMHLMNIRAIYPLKSLSKLGNTPLIKPYLLRGLKITHPNQVWSTDITYIPMKQGFMYLYAVIDVYSRTIIGWSLSNSLQASNGLELIKRCITKHGKTEIVNSDQGSQYTSNTWCNYLASKGIKISMDSKGRCKDNSWIERFWRTIKQEQIYLNPADNGIQLYNDIKKYMQYYNEKRPHQGIKTLIPYQKYSAVA
ncbi:MAG: IS3 family transposase [Bacteroidaceae bacterium]|nr:IS3 family transposase [Bacteroidaceae bacterium]